MTNGLDVGLILWGLKELRPCCIEVTANDMCFDYKRITSKTQKVTRMWLKANDLMFTRPSYISRLLPPSAMNLQRGVGA